MEIPAPTIPVMEVTEKQTPEKIAHKLRTIWNVETPIIENLTSLIEDHNIITATFPFGTDRVDSRSILTDYKFPIIFKRISAW